MALKVLPADVRLKGASGMGAAIGAEGLVCALMFAQIGAVSAGKVAEAALMRFLSLVFRGNVCLELSVRRS